MTSNIKIYGTSTCKDCIIAKQVFQDLGTDYEFINMEDDSEATRTAIELNDGVRKIPVIQFEDGSLLVEPSYQQLKDKISSE